MFALRGCHVQWCISTYRYSMFKSWRARRNSGAANLRESMGIILKNKDEIEQMRVAGQLEQDCDWHAKQRTLWQ